MGKERHYKSVWSESIPKNPSQVKSNHGFRNACSQHLSVDKDSLDVVRYGLPFSNEQIVTRIE